MQLLIFIFQKLRSRSPVAQPQEVAIPIPRTWDGLSFEDAVMKAVTIFEHQPFYLEVGQLRKTNVSATIHYKKFERK